MQRRRFIRSLGAFAACAAAPQAFSQQPLPVSKTQGDTTPDIARQLARYALALDYDDLGSATIEAVKTHLADALGCGIAAFHESPVRMAREVSLANGNPQGGATVLGTRNKTSSDLAAFANGAAIRYYDLNDVYAGKEVGHPSDNVSACLAQAEVERVNGRALIVAIALAYEIDCRLMDATSVSARGWDHPVYSLPAVALATGKLMNLDEDRLVEAVNLAINSHIALNQTRVQTMSNWKGVADADAARNAVFSAELARAGITGPSPIFEGEAGLLQQVTGPLSIETSTFGGRENRFRILDCGVKLRPAQVMTQTAIVAAIDVARQAGNLDRIQSVEIRTSHEGWFSAGKDRQKWAPETSETADHSLPYIVARAMFDGDITLNSYTPQKLSDPRIRAFMQKIRVADDPEMTRLYPKYDATVVTATLDDGKTASSRVDDVPGFATHPMQREDFEKKFRANVASILAPRQADDALAAVWALDRSADISAIFEPLTVVS